MLKISETKYGIRLEIKVQPRSSRNQFAGEQAGVLKVKLTAPPVDGEANKALVNFLAATFKIPKKNIQIVRGETARHKIVDIKGIKPDDFLEMI